MVGIVVIFFFVRVVEFMFFWVYRVDLVCVFLLFNVFFDFWSFVFIVS